MISLQNLFSIPSVLESILDHSTTDSLLLNVRAINRYLYYEVEHYIRLRALSYLYPFFETAEEIQSFSNLLFKTDSLISGSTALCMIQRESFGSNSDLDLYIARYNQNQFEDWLKPREWVERPRSMADLVPMRTEDGYGYGDGEDGEAGVNFQGIEGGVKAFTKGDRKIDLIMLSEHGHYVCSSMRCTERN